MRTKLYSKQREKECRGEKRISEDILNGITESEYRRIYNNNCKLGIIWALHKETPRRMLTMKEIGEIIGFGRGTVKNNLIHPSGLMHNGILSTSIKKYDIGQKLRTKRGWVFFYMNNAPFSELSYEALKGIFLNQRVSHLCPNISEREIMDICDELYPGGFKFTGAILPQNRIGDKYPDITGIKYPIIIEHCGTHHHKKDYPEKRIAHWKAHGYFCLVIVDYDKRNRNKVKIEIKEFVDNAIQNIQQLVV